jgi:hypothetical protein
LKVKEQIAKEMRAFKRGVFLAVLVAVAPKRPDGWPICPFCGTKEAKGEKPGGGR